MPAFTMRVFRGNASGGALRDYKVEADEGMVVLDAVSYTHLTLPTNREV